ncbi:hypothetical protein B0H19DRAFT_965398, partial [Mycena capillaripes]
LALLELSEAIPKLWNTVTEFVKGNPELVFPNNALGFLSDNGGESYNNCVRSNFKIAEPWTSTSERSGDNKFFEHLDSKGVRRRAFFRLALFWCFYCELCRDHTVHSISAALFARKTRSYAPFAPPECGHLAPMPFQHCPQGPLHRRGKCECVTDSLGA